jgi:hypothetical protein
VVELREDFHSAEFVFQAAEDWHNRDAMHVANQGGRGGGAHLAKVRTSLI